mgnify:CR=1 FL=1
MRVNYESYVSNADIPKHRILDFDERVHVATTALIVIDVQNDFCDSKGRCAESGQDLSLMPAMIENTKRLIASARDKGILTVFVRSSYGEAERGAVIAEQQKRYFGTVGDLCIEGTWGIEFVPGTEPAGLPNEVVITKHRPSLFWGTEIDLVLRSNGIKSVVICGVATEEGVESSARAAFFRDYYVVIAEDCCAGYSVDGHKAALANLDLLYAKISTGREVAASWTRSNSEDRGWKPEAKRQRLLGSLATRVNPRHTALVLVDMQNDFCSPGGRLDKNGESLNLIRETVPRVVRLLNWARASAVKVLHVRTEHDPITSHEDMRVDSKAEPSRTALQRGRMLDSCISGSWGAEIVDAIVPLPEEMIVLKHRFSGFMDTRLELLLKSNGIETIVVAGVTTNCSVESTVRDAVMRDFYAVVAEDCVATPDSAAHLHRSTLDTLQLHFCLVRLSDSIGQCWNAKIQ